jgi:hypothetical protein
MKRLVREQVVETMHGYHNGSPLKEVLNQYVARDSDKQLALALSQYTQNNQVQRMTLSPRLSSASRTIYAYPWRYVNC